jgi:hypothetical protein
MEGKIPTVTSRKHPKGEGIRTEQVREGQQVRVLNHEGDRTFTLIRRDGEGVGILPTSFGGHRGDDVGILRYNADGVLTLGSRRKKDFYRLLEFFDVEDDRILNLGVPPWGLKAGNFSRKPAGTEVGTIGAHEKVEVPATLFLGSARLSDLKFGLDSILVVQKLDEGANILRRDAEIHTGIGNYGSGHATTIGGNESAIPCHHLTILGLDGIVLRHKQLADHQSFGEFGRIDLPHNSGRTEDLIPSAEARRIQTAELQLALATLGGDFPVLARCEGEHPTLTNGTDPFVKSPSLNGESFTLGGLNLGDEGGEGENPSGVREDLKNPTLISE